MYQIAVVQDITEQRQARAQLQLAASVFSHAREGIMITEMDGRIIDVNESFSRITGYTRHDVLGANPRLLKSGLQSEAFYQEMWRAVGENGFWTGEVWNMRANGSLYAVMQTISVVFDAEGRPSNLVSLFADITAIKEHERQLERIAHFDALTGLPNRVLLADRLGQAMLQAQRRGDLLAVVFLDLDGFKRINDTHGHDVGDRVLMGVAAALKAGLREGDTLSRIGGDEFVAVLADLPDTDTGTPLLERLLAAANRAQSIDGQALQVSASLGVTFFPQREPIDAEQLQRQADQAMYQAKLAGKNRYHVFDAEQDRSARGHFESLSHIRSALAGNEFVLYYQPKVNMRSGQVMGLEALIRWQHPERGLLAPGLFLPAIENHPLAVDVGNWVLRSALAQMSHWRGQGLTLPVSVNVGARQLLQRDFVEGLRDLLAEFSDVPPQWLELEVLETSALEDVAVASQVVEACRVMGVRFALDDFGTGYSSLTYLKRLPVAVLKIDQSFVRDMLDDVDDLAILKGVIGLAQAFAREVMAEGVETEAHGRALLALGCELAQGYGIARPMPAAQVPDWVAAWQPFASWRGA
jgi:diguanylate cyclase (GGDEF)-like protein/PAS domain S-box-containing protein